MPMKRRFEIIPIVESEIVPDQSLELIKGGGYITTCSEGYSCETYVNGHCSLNTCLKGYCYVCQELTLCSTIPNAGNALCFRSVPADARNRG